MRLAPLTLRIAALLLAGALAVHEGRYALAALTGTGAQGAAGHGYLTALSPLAAGALAMLVAVGLRGWAYGREGCMLVRRVGPAALWLALSAALLAAFAVQELAEAALSPARAGGPAAAFGAGGLWALPLSALAAVPLAIVLRARPAVAARAPRPVPLPVAPAAAGAAPLPAAPARLLLPRPAGRGPPR
jgi:hypothetical protein